MYDPQMIICRRKMKVFALFLTLCLILYYLLNMLLRTNLMTKNLIQAVTLSDDPKTKNNLRCGSPLGDFFSPAPNLSGSESATIHMLTYNLWGHYFVGNFQNYEDRIETFAENVKDFDIVLVQEMFLLRAGPLFFSKYAEMLVTAMEARGFCYRSDLQGSLPKVFGQTSGVITFSRVPVLSTKSEIFQAWGWREGTTNKGFAYVELSQPQMYIFNVHLDAHKADIRERQLLQVLSTMEQLPASSPVVIGGDFNIDAPKETTSLSSKEYQQLCHVLARKNFRVVFPERPVTITKEHSNTDQIFVSSNFDIESKKVVQLYTKAGEMVSDHYGLAVQLEVIG